MALLGSDFIAQIANRTTHCSECDRTIPVGARSLVSIKRGKVQKRVCSEACRQTFDDRVWQAIATINERKRKRTART